MENEIKKASPDSLIALAVEKDFDIEKLEKLMALKERHDAEQSRKAYYQAFAKFQSLCPSIKKTKVVSFAHKDGSGGTAYAYAPLGDICEQIRQPLMECGLSYRFIQEHSAVIKVSCVVTHDNGHSEAVEMQAPLDNSGKKNAIQSIGSTVSYLQRYTLLSVLGIATADSDMDGRIAQSTNDVLLEWQTMAISRVANEKNTGDQNVEQFINRLCKWKKVKRVEDIPSAAWPSICKTLNIDQKDGKNIK